MDVAQGDTEADNVENHEENCEPTEFTGAAPFQEVLRGKEKAG